MESGGGVIVSLFPLTHNSAVEPYHYNIVWLVKVHNFDEIRSGQMCTGASIKQHFVGNKQGQIFQGLLSY